MNKTTSNGWSMLGICSQWAEDNDLTVNEQSVYITIARESVAYKKRWCYVKYDKFKVSNRNTIKKVLKSLVDKKIIHYSQTFKSNGHRAMNEYRLLEPKNMIKNFVFLKSKEETVKQEEEQPPW